MRIGPDETVALGQSAAVQAPATARRAESARGSRRQREDLLIKLGSFVLLFVAWWLASLTLPATILPGPAPTFATLWENALSGILLEQFLITMSRILAGFALSMVMGIVAGTLMGLWRRAEVALDLWVMVALTIPSLCYIIVTFMWFGMNEFSTVLAIALTSFPAIAITVWEGVKNVDNRLGDMAKTFRASRWERLTEVVMPQVFPYLLASSRFGLGIVWKVTVLAELLGRSNGIGFQLHQWFQLYNMRQVLAWTVFFTLVMLFIELLLLKQLELRLFRWRPSARL
jgi:NitT/TauT family transport system permease protein